jgi:hypothetical protein
MRSMLTRTTSYHDFRLLTDLQRDTYGQCSNQYQPQNDVGLCNEAFFTCVVAGALPVCDATSITGTALFIQFGA